MFSLTIFYSVFSYYKNINCVQYECMYEYTYISRSIMAGAIVPIELLLLSK
jgi:hypothetical protein